MKRTEQIIKEAKEAIFGVIEKLEAALAEKDTQLARRPTREWEHSLQMSLRGKNDAIAELNKKYHDLMAQAIRFAEMAKWPLQSDREAIAFLDRPEVQAFKAQQEEDKWIREKAEQEDGCDVSAGRLGQAQQKEGGK